VVGVVGGCDLGRGAPTAADDAVLVVQVRRSASYIGLMEGVSCGEGRGNFACGEQK